MKLNRPVYVYFQLIKITESIPTYIYILLILDNVIWYNKNLYFPFGKICVSIVNYCYNGIEMKWPWLRNVSSNRKIQCWVAFWSPHATYVFIRWIPASRHAVHKNLYLQTFHHIFYTKIIQTSKQALWSILKFKPGVNCSVYLCQRNTMKCHL